MEQTEKPVENGTIQPVIPESVNNTNTTADLKKKIGWAVLILILLIAAAVWGMLKLTPETTALIRDISIVAFVLETFVVLTALVVLVIRLGKLINITKAGVQPILKTTGETMNSVKGTVTFLSNNLIEPTIQVNAKVNGIARAADTILKIFKH